MLHAADGRLLGAADLACHAAGSKAVPHPDRTHVGLSAGEGQDGAEIYWGRWERDRLVVSRLDDRSRVLIDVRPDGSQYLTTPHSGGPGCAVRTHDFPDGGTRAKLDASAVLPGDDGFDFCAGYLTNDSVLVGSIENDVHLLLSADMLSPIGRIEYPDADAHHKACISPTGHGTWLTTDGVSGIHQLWCLTDDA